MLLETRITVRSILLGRGTSAKGVGAVFHRAFFLSLGEISARWALTVTHRLDEFDVRRIEEADESDVVAGQAFFATRRTGKEI